MTLPMNDFKVTAMTGPMTDTPTRDIVAHEVAKSIATEILHHIDTMYPGMWADVPGTARKSLRNVILNKGHQIFNALTAEYVRGQRDMQERVENMSEQEAADIFRTIKSRYVAGFPISTETGFEKWSVWLARMIAAISINTEKEGET